MFFSSRKKKKLAEEAQKQEQQRIQQEAKQKLIISTDAFVYNKVIFNNICNMVRSRPKERHIVVVQRKNVFRSNSDRNRAYLELATSLHYKHQSTGQMWMCAYGNNSDALYAFYKPTKLTDELEHVLEIFSEDGFRIKHIRYYSQNL